MWDFGQALLALKRGERVWRQGWEAWLRLQVPDSHSKMTHPYIYLVSQNGKRIPWIPSQTDMLSEDWYGNPVNEANE